MPRGKEMIKKAEFIKKDKMRGTVEGKLKQMTEFRMMRVRKRWQIKSEFQQETHSHGKRTGIARRTHG